jgi:hypothetical protein
VIIHGYIMTMADDADVLPDALNSMAMFCDRVYLTDGLMGAGTLCHQQRLFTPLKDTLIRYPKFGYDASLARSDAYVFTWGDVPVVLWENSFRDPAHQRNWTLTKMLQEPDQPDWIHWHDSDEIASWELIQGIRGYLEKTPPEIAGISVKWLTLVQDEQHCVKHMSSWLAHPRIHRPASAYFQGNWHEHMVIDRSHLASWDVRVIHTRALFTERLRIQRGHDSIASGQTPLWADAEMIPVPDGVTWGGLLHWPEGERPTPFK